MKDTQEMAAALSKRLRELREQRGWSISTLASLSGVSVSQLYRLEKGERPRVAAVTLARIAQALETSVDYLLGLTDNSKPQT